MKYNQQEQTMQCLQCDGYQYTCKQYIVDERANDRCVWHYVIDRDLQTLQTGSNCITFGYLEQVIKGDTHEKRNSNKTSK